MKQIVKLSLVLLLVCVIVAGVLGGVNELTAARIEALNAKKTQEAYGAVLPSSEGYRVLQDEAFRLVVNGQKIKILTLLEANDGQGYVVETQFSGAQGEITMVVGVNKELCCTGISIIQHAETSGLGANAASSAEVGTAFREQFKGQDGSLALRKNGGEIDALSGATITSRAVVNATAAAIEAVRSLQEGGADA